MFTNRDEAAIKFRPSRKMEIVRKFDNHIMDHQRQEAERIHLSEKIDKIDQALKLNKELDMNTILSFVQSAIPMYIRSKAEKEGRGGYHRR